MLAYKVNIAHFQLFMLYCALPFLSIPLVFPEEKSHDMEPSRRSNNSKNKSGRAREISSEGLGVLSLIRVVFLLYFYCIIHHSIFLELFSKVLSLTDEQGYRLFSDESILIYLW